jgi:hypothetical protein
VEKADPTGLFLVVPHEVGLYIGMIFYFEFPYTARVTLLPSASKPPRKDKGKSQS